MPLDHPRVQTAKKLHAAKSMLDFEIAKRCKSLGQQHARWLL
jgi:hypothetical protein